MKMTAGALRFVLGPVLPVAGIVLAAAACSSSSSNPPTGPDGGDQGDTGSGIVPEGGGADGSVADGSSALDGSGGADHSVADASSALDGSVVPDSSAGPDGSGIGDGAAAIVVTSPAFTEGQTIPAVYTCAGANTSPEIDWTAGPAGTLSYAVVVSDLTATANIHWVVWDLPPGTRSLPAMLPTDPTLTTPVMANQVDLRTNPEAGTSMNGYFGPCPNGNLHSYEYAVHALDVATLPGVTTTSLSSAVKVVVNAHTLAQGTLDGTSSAARPTDAGGQ